MIKIAICDDHNIICSQIEEIILNYSKKISCKIEIDVFYSGEKLIEAMNNGENYDLIFLDIELELLNGVQAARIIRDEIKNERTQIIFISGNDSYALELFEVRPLNFLIKPLSTEKIEATINKAIKLIKTNNQFFEFSFSKYTYKVLYSDILYFESEGKKVNIITTSGRYEFYAKLQNIEKSLKESDFLNIHKSYLINYIHVIEYNYEYVVMSNGIKLAISQQNRKDIRNSLLSRKQRRKFPC